MNPTPKDARDPTRRFVGIGASAGGLGALRQLLPALPHRRGFSYVLVQHMDPHHRSTLDQILGKHTALTVSVAADGARLRPDHLYIAPSNKDCTVIAGALRLEDTRDAGARHSVDVLFTSLAEAHGADAAGIVLSGTGSDGLHGAHALKAHEGLVLVQSPGDAEHSGMPGAILEARLADIVAPAAELGSELAQVFGRAADGHAVDLEGRAGLIQMLVHKTGFPFDQYKDSTMNRRIERRMVVNKLTTPADYLALIERSDKEAALLLKDLQISVTGFFRDQEGFDGLRDALEAVIAHKPAGEPLRIWVPGCATGEEAFSIAVLVLELLGNRRSASTVQIFATDIDADAIAHARRSLYFKTLLGSVPAHLVEKYFAATDGTYKVRPEVRDLVVFAEHDLMQDPPFGRLDLVSCRNVMIYFKRPAQERVLRHFHYVLNPGAYLFLGPSEGVGGLSELFTPVNKLAKLYRRLEANQPPPAFARGPRGRHIAPRTAGAPRTASLGQRMRDALFEQYAPPCILVDPRFDIVQLRGDLGPFMQLPQGEITVSALDLAVAPLRLELRLILQRSQRERALARSRPIEVVGTGEPRLVTLVALPIQAEPETEVHTLVLFESRTPLEQVDSAASASEAADFRIRELKQELIATRDHLQTNIEELETANEELQSINEEFQSTTEELQSANEEFQTTNEELQSTNEELHTVNEEMKSKAHELETVNRDLEDILSAVVEGIIVLDEDLRVTRYSTGAKEVLDLLPTSIGRPLIALGGPFDLTALASEIRTVLRTRRPMEIELELRDRLYLARLIPGSIGLVISFLDATQRLLDSRDARRLATVVRDANDAITVLDLDGRVLAWNAGAERLYGYTTPEALRLHISDLVPPAHADSVADFVQQLMAGQAPDAFETVRRTKDGNELGVWVTATALRNEAGEVYALATTERDVGAHRAADAARRAAVLSLDVHERYARLTPREREVLALIVNSSGSASSRQIGETLGVGARTVDSHRRQIKQKLGATSIPDLIEKVRVAGIREPDAN